MISDKDFLQAVDRLRDEWDVLVGAEKATTIIQWMDETQIDDPESAQQTAGHILDLLQVDTEARQRIAGELGIKGVLPLSFRTYDPLAGAANEIPAGTLVVCPVEPGHCRKTLRMKGQKLFCPLHGVALVPEDQVGPKE